ncbi:chymotrypsin inhibitor Ani s 6-like isoform X1 [Diabrotica virgifera virgifera]|uniref:Chymotrypsin inhibitor Ani s 6-like isoform X1 n=1 Tax=Diabrotica virgifera virgifera TaxID=50390 RepID=A0A6P7FZY5_DIAVI|nr:chymotrypsin inhibitor Ani s 6-like isoform X1 [Diabrotica virgifera virgifera]
MKLTVVVAFCLIFMVNFAVSSYIKKNSCDDPNAHYGCESPCIPTCNYRQFANCASKCINGCFCNQDYILSREQGKCVLVKDCFPH